MCSGRVRIRRVNSHTLIVFIAPNRLCDYEKLLHQNVCQYTVFPIARVPAIIPLRAVGCRPLIYTIKHCEVMTKLLTLVPAK